MNKIEELINQNNTFFDFDSESYLKLFEKKSLNEFGRFRVLVKPYNLNHFSFKAFKLDTDMSANGVNLFYDQIHMKGKLFKDVVDEIIQATEPFGREFSQIGAEDSFILDKSSVTQADQTTNPQLDNKSISIRNENPLKEKEDLNPSNLFIPCNSKEASFQDKSKTEVNLSGFDY